ncbi:MAG: serine hydrolase [Marinilabiliales bacterium]|nr:MAG: serine hydrolase [Marinilabiliales bacterium]
MPNKITMKLSLLTVFLSLCLFSASHSQSLYFPPIDNDNWETISTDSLNWCPDSIASLQSYLENTNTKAFIVLKNGKIAVEWYFNNHTQDSLWYWASAGKTIAAFLTGICQEAGKLNIEDKVSDYLGNGWTSAPLAKENLIKIRNLLDMTTGLDDSYTPSQPPENCTDDTCLLYLADAGTRWAYHNAPYYLLQDLMAVAVGSNFNLITNYYLENLIGMNGFWFNHTYYSNCRSMARFGLLNLNKGIWDTDTVMHNQNYFEDMIHPSQNMNDSYGYLWWLNGQNTYMLPGSQIVFQGNLIPYAPADMYSALGKNDQKIYVVPSKNMVIVRMGESADISLYALSNYDNELWGRLSSMNCDITNQSSYPSDKIEVYPNPTHTNITVKLNQDSEIHIELFDITGLQIFNKAYKTATFVIDMSQYISGTYILKIKNIKGDIVHTEKIIKE